MFILCMFVMKNQCMYNKTSLMSPDCSSVSINSHGGKLLCMCSVGSKAHALLIIWSLSQYFILILTCSIMFICKYIYCSMYCNKNIICIVQYVIFKLLFHFLPVLVSYIASVPTTDR